MLAQLFAALTITVMIQSPGEIQSGWEARGNEGLILGWAEWQETVDGLNRRNCVIHVPELSAITLDIWVHEIRHCRVGDFHLDE